MKKFRIILALTVLALMLSCTAFATEPAKGTLVLKPTEITYNADGIEVALYSAASVTLKGSNTLGIKYDKTLWTYEGDPTTEVPGADAAVTPGVDSIQLAIKTTTAIPTIAITPETALVKVKFVPVAGKTEAELVGSTFGIQAGTTLKCTEDGSKTKTYPIVKTSKATVVAAAKEPTIDPSGSKAEGTLTGQYGNPDRKYIADQLTLKNVAAAKEVNAFDVTFAPTVDPASVPADKNPSAVTKRLEFSAIRGGADIVLNVVLIDIPSYITDVAITGTPVYVD